MVSTRSRRYSIDNMADPDQQATINQLTNQVAALQAQVQNLQGRNPQNQAVTFALNPSTANDAVIDMSTKEGMKIYEAGLQKVHTTLFDGKSKNVNFFRANVNRKATDAGWNHAAGAGNIFQIEDTSVTPSKTYDIVYQTQEVPLRAIEDFATTKIIGQQTRAAQNNHMAVQSLLDSLDESMQKSMLTDTTSYTKGNTQIAPLLFRTIIMKSENPGRGQIKVLKDTFKELKEKIKGMKISDFNDYVRGNYTSLASFGHKMDEDDLVEYIIAAYKVSDDNLFNEHFKKQERKWLKGEINLKYKDLLEDGLREYGARVHDKDAGWGALSDEQQEIIALTAKIEVLRKEVKSKPKSRTKEEKPLESDKKGKQIPNYRKKDAWKFNATVNGKTYKAGDKFSRDGKDYWWCPHHYDTGMWSRHKPAVCTRNPRKEEANAATGTDADEVADEATEENEDDEEDVEGLLAQFVVDDEDEE